MTRIKRTWWNLASLALLQTPHGWIDSLIRRRVPSERADDEYEKCLAGCRNVQLLGI